MLYPQNVTLGLQNCSTTVLRTSFIYKYSSKENKTLLRQKEQKKNLQGLITSL